MTRRVTGTSGQREKTATGNPVFVFFRGSLSVQDGLQKITGMRSHGPRSPIAMVSGCHFKHIVDPWQTRQAVVLLLSGQGLQDQGGEERVQCIGVLRQKPTPRWSFCRRDCCCLFRKSLFVFVVHVVATGKQNVSKRHTT